MRARRVAAAVLAAVAFAAGLAAAAPGAREARPPRLRGGPAAAARPHRAPGEGARPGRGVARRGGRRPQGLREGGERGQPRALRARPGQPGPVGAARGAGPSAASARGRRSPASSALAEKLLRLQYEQGGQDRLRLILEGKDLATLTRHLAYFGYVQRARAETLAALKRGAEEVAALEAEAREKRAAIAENQAAQAREIAAAREGARGACRWRSSALAGQVAKGKREIGRLKRDEERLTRLVRGDRPGARGERGPEGPGGAEGREARRRAAEEPASGGARPWSRWPTPRLSAQGVPDPQGASSGCRCAGNS